MLSERRAVSPLPWWTLRRHPRTRCEIADPHDTTLGVFIGSMAIVLGAQSRTCKSGSTVGTFHTGFPEKEKYVSGLIEGGQAPPQLGAEAVPGAAHPHTRTAPRGLPRTLDRPWRMCTDTARPGDPTSTAQTGEGMSGLRTGK